MSSLGSVPSGVGAQGGARNPGSAHWEEDGKKWNARPRLGVGAEHGCRSWQLRTLIRKHGLSGLSKSQLPLAQSLQPRSPCFSVLWTLAHTLQPRSSCLSVLWTTMVCLERLQWLKGGRSGFPEPSVSQKLTSARSFTSLPTWSSVFLAGILEMLI